MAFKLRMMVDMHGIHTHAHFDDLDFDFERVVLSCCCSVVIIYCGLGRRIHTRMYILFVCLPVVLCFDCHHTGSLF